MVPLRRACPPLRCTCESPQLQPVEDVSYVDDNTFFVPHRDPREFMRRVVAMLESVFGTVEVFGLKLHVSPSKTALLITRRGRGVHAVRND
eukprot:11132148-Alexandrium_andersonii.AAC.1